MLLQYSENKRYMQIKRQMFSIINRKCYLCIENRKGCQNSILITKSNNQLAQCNFSDYCLLFIHIEVENGTSHDFFLRKSRSKTVFSQLDN